MSTPRRSIDVSDLPTEVFGHRGVTWWATVGFMLIEGTTLAIGLLAYYYLRGNFQEWPPPTTPPPALFPGTVVVLLLLAKLYPTWKAGQAAHRKDVAGIRRWMVIASGVALLGTTLRGVEFGFLNTRWDFDAYGSVVWLVIGLHSTLMLVDVFEMTIITAIFFTDRVESKHFVDVEDASLYEVFLSLSWLPGYITLYLVPRWS